MKQRKYVALLRGINVGGNNKVPMSKLKTLFEHLGFENVSTYINSGNVIFETSLTDTQGMMHRIEKEIEKDFGFKVRVLVKDLKNIRSILARIPAKWLNDAEQRTDVIFLWENYNKKSSLALIKINPEVDSLMYTNGAIIWSIKRSDYKKSKMNKFIGTEVYKNMTARNINTTRKLQELMSQGKRL